MGDILQAIFFDFGTMKVMDNKWNARVWPSQGNLFHLQSFDRWKGSTALLCTSQADPSGPRLPCSITKTRSCRPIMLMWRQSRGVNEPRSTGTHQRNDREHSPAGGSICYCTRRLSSRGRTLVAIPRKQVNANTLHWDVKAVNDNVRKMPYDRAQRLQSEPCIQLWRF